MSKTSCIQHRPKTPLVILHQDYLDICDDNKSAAIILRILEYWTNIKIDGRKQVEIENKIRAKESFTPLDADLWVYKSYQDFIDDSLGLLKEYQVRGGIKILLKRGYISKRNNPRYTWDRTLQYRLNIEILQMVINNVFISDIQRMEDEPVTDQSITGNGTIPETTTEITTETQGDTKNFDYLDNIGNHRPGQEGAIEPSGFDKHFGKYRDEVLNIYNKEFGITLNQGRKDKLIELSRAERFDIAVFEDYTKQYNVNGGYSYDLEKFCSGYWLYLDGAKIKDAMYPEASDRKTSFSKTPEWEKTGKLVIP